MNLKSATTILLFTLLTLSSWAQRKSYWAQKVDYTMDIDVDEKTFRYDGKMNLKYSNNSGQELNKVYFHLYFNAFQPGSMMDERLQNIVDPDKRMVINEGTKEKPIFKSRIASLEPDQMGYQKIKSIKYNGSEVSFQEDGT
ncbi:MAG: M1 family peptidase, partial [Sphingobacterium sp.]